MPVKEYIFCVDGLKCQGCSTTVETVLKDCGIISATCDHVTRRLTVFVDARKPAEKICAEIKQRVTEVGFECEALINHTSHVKSQLNRWLMGGLGLGSGMTLLIFNLLGVAFSMPAMIAIAGLSTAMTLFLGTEFYWNAFKVYRQSRELNMNTLFTISTLTVLVVSVMSFFVPVLPMIFDAGLLIFGFRHIGIAIESTIKQTVVSDLQFKDYIPHTVELADAQSSMKRLADVQINDVIIIRPGEVIPVDGLCLSETGLMYDTIHTGARIPRITRQGEDLLAGMYLAEDSTPIFLKVLKSSTDSYLARFDQQITSANQKQPLQTVAKKLLQYFIPFVLLCSLASLVLIGSFFSLSVAIQSAVAVLVSACPCTLGMIIPLAVKVGMNKAASLGVQFKSAKVLEEVGELADKMDTVVFDLHGTLSRGKPKVVDFIVRPEFQSKQHELLGYFALLEKNSPHPVAHAICDYISKQNIPAFQAPLTDLNHASHVGISARIDGSVYVLGSKQMMTLEGIDTSCVKPESEKGESLVYLARDGKIVGTMHLSDPLRQDAKVVVDTLQEQGKTVYICTGADKSTAMRYAAQLGIPERQVKAVQRGCTSDSEQTKMAFIRSLQQNGHCVAMIGDGPNDAAALAASDISIAVNTGDDIGHRVSQDQATAVIDNGSLKPILSGFAVAEQTVSNIKQNLLLSFGYNAITMILAGGGLLPLAAAVVGMIVQSVSILLNTYRFKLQPLAHLDGESGGKALEGSSYQNMMSNVLAPDEDNKPGKGVLLGQGANLRLFASEPCKPKDKDVESLPTPVNS